MYSSGGKAGKKDFMNETLKLLVSSFGGEAALKRKAPICAGRYNSTKANDVSGAQYSGQSKLN